MIGTAKQLIRQSLYALGFYSLLHRVRNRNALTVFMFHRVLPRDSLTYTKAEREFTMSTEGFGSCLEFIKKHYNVVSHSAIKEHFLNNGKLLPPCPALITFDDGWRDTLLHAIPELKRLNMPATLFLATQVTALPHDRWWQDMLVEALATPINLPVLESEFGLLPSSQATWSDRVRQLTSTLAESDTSIRQNVLAKYVTPIADGRQMLTSADLASLPPLISIAGHGHTHGPLSLLRDTQADLKVCHQRLRQLNADVWAISYPHGDQNSSTFANAINAGFSLCYSSEPYLVNTAAKFRAKQALGRIHIPENQWTCCNGNVSHAKLATFLFFRGVR